MLARECDPVLTQSSLSGNPDDRQARYIEAAVNGVLIASIYLPNGNPQPGPKFDYKLAWFERLIEHGAELMKARVPVAWPAITTSYRPCRTSIQRVLSITTH
jgi:exodeoxyribonuclease-3